MKKIKITVVAVVLALAAALTGIESASAQLIYVPATTTANPVSTSECTSFARNLSVGVRGIDVTTYQIYLINRGYLAAGNSTGYFGPLTRAATMRFQAENSISATGFVGPLTRARLAVITCEQVNPPINPPVGTAPVITSISPSVGPFGTVVTIYGRGFSRFDNAINFGNVNRMAFNVQSFDGTSLQFTIPYGPCAQGSQVCTLIAYAPGTFPISVSNAGGTSNVAYFTATDSSSSGTNAPVISGVNGPTTLGVGQTGTWSVQASDPTNAGLSYQVVWGDEGQAGASYANSNSYTQSTTFTHSYNQAGTYTPTFTVRSSNGYTAQTSMTVIVSGQSNNSSPSITSISPNSGPYGTLVTITGSNFGTYNNSINFAGTNSVATNVYSPNGQTLQFTIPATPCAVGNYCAQVALQPGTYPISVTTPSGTTNQAYFTLTSGSTATGAPVVSSISPSTVSYGTQVTVYGSNFSRYNNTVNFSNSSFQSLSGIQSYDGTSLQFTLNSSNQGGVGALPSGQYPFTIGNEYGTSATNYFNYTSGGGSYVNQSVTLALGQTGTIYDLQITPNFVSEDSRCAIGTTCVWAGRVVVQTTIRSNAGQSSVNLAMGEEFTSNGYRVKLMDVTPAKYANQNINNNDYRFIFQITR